MQETAPGGFQIMWKPSAVPSTANPATFWNMFRRKNKHPMKIMIIFVGVNTLKTRMNPINAHILLSAAHAEFTVWGGIMF